MRRGHRDDGRGFKVVRGSGPELEAFKEEAPAIYAQQVTVVGPTQFVTQRVTNRKRQVKKSHVAQIGGIKPTPKLRGQRVR